MRGSRFALVGLALLLVLAGAVAMASPLLDWNRYRDNFADLASSVLGRPVRIEGAVSLNLLPHPEISASQISIADGGDGIAIRAQQLRLRVSLPGLLTGHLDPLELVLQQPLILLPWPFNPAALTHRPDWLSGLSARIEDAEIQLGSLNFTDVDGSFAPDTQPNPVSGLLTGTTTGLAARAHGQFMGHSWRMMARLGDPRESAGEAADADPTRGGEPAVPAQLVLDGEGPLADTGASFNGQIAADGSISAFVTGRGPDLSQLVPAPAVGWRAQGRVSIADGLASADDLALQLAGATGRAAVALRLSPKPRLDLALAAARIDLDAWIEALRPRPAAPGLLTGIDLSADTALFHGAALRRVRIAADLGPREVTVREAAALLAGDASLALSGRLSLGPAGDAAMFDGEMTAAAPDLRASLAAFQQLGLVPAAPLPDGVLRSAQLAADLHLAGGRLTLDDMRGSLDDSRIAGVVGLRLGPGGRPAIAARLSVDQLALDPWLRGVSLGAGATRALAAKLFAIAADADLRLEVARATWASGIPAPFVLDHLVLDAALEKGVLTLRDLQGGGGGLQAALSGTLAEGGQLSGARLLVVGPDAAPLRALLPAAWQGTETIWHAPLTLDVTADGPPGAVEAVIGVELGDARIDARPVINLAAGTATGSVTVRHPGASRLLGLLGIPGADWLGEGSLSVISHLAVSPSGLVLDPLAANAADLHAGGRLLMGFGGEPLISGQLSFTALPLPLPAFDQPLPVDLLRGWRADASVSAATVRSAAGDLLGNAAAHVTLSDGVLRLDDLTGTLAGGDLAASLRFDGRATPPALAVRARLQGASIAGPLFDLPMDLAQGRLDGDLTMQASGYSPSGLAATLAGSAHADVRDGVISGFDAAAAADALDLPSAAAAVAAARAALSAGTTGFAELSLGLTATPGLIDATAHLTAPRVSVNLAGTFDLGGKRLDTTVQVQPPQPGAPTLTAWLTGPFQSPTRTSDLSALPAWLGGR